MSRNRDDMRRLDNVNILDVAMQLGIDVRRNKKAICFLHADTDPSLTFYPETGTWHCFGCGKHGNIVELVKKYNRCSFQEACRWLDNHFKTGTWEKPGYNAIRYTPLRKPLPAAPDPVQIDSDLYAAIIGNLSLSSCGKKYLCEERRLPFRIVQDSNIRSIDDISEFYKNLEKTYDTKRLFDAGLLIVDQYGELRPCWRSPGIVFPYYSSKGEIVNLQLRPYENDNCKKGPKYIFLHKIPTAMYNEHLLKKYKTNENLYLCEGVIDTLSMLANGYNSVGIPGVHSFRDEWLDRLGSYPIIILFDNDNAGQEGAKTLCSLMSSKNINVSIQHLPPQFKDVNSMLTARGDKYERE